MGLLHMIMNFIQLIFNELYDSKSINEIGSLKFLQDRMCRVSVNADVKMAYDPDKEFVLAVKDAYCAAAVTHHFGMTNYSDMLLKNVCPDSQSDVIDWFKEQLTVIVNSVINLSEMHTEGEIVEGIIGTSS